MTGTRPTRTPSTASSGTPRAATRPTRSATSAGGRQGNSRQSAVGSKEAHRLQPVGFCSSLPPGLELPDKTHTSRKRKRRKLNRRLLVKTPSTGLLSASSYGGLH